MAVNGDWPTGSDATPSTAPFFTQESQMGAMKNLAVKRAMSHNRTRINPTVEPPVPLCQYCNRVLDGPAINGLHVACNDRLSEEWAEWKRQRPLLVME